MYLLRTVTYTKTAYDSVYVWIHNSRHTHLVFKHSFRWRAGGDLFCEPNTKHSFTDSLEQTCAGWDGRAAVR